VSECLQNAKDSRRVSESHAAAVEFYRPRNEKMEANTNVLRNRLYTADELKAYEEQHRQPVSINKALAPFRTVIGTIMQSGFDSSFLPFDESDEPLAEILQKLAVFESERNDDFNQNSQMCQAAYVMGRSYRLHWVEQGFGKQPKIKSKVLNPYAVYFDPDSIDVVARADAEFVDVVHWLSYNEIVRAFPESAAKISHADKKERNFLDEYERYDKSTNRKHEDLDELNGKYKVVERYYRVCRNTPGAPPREELWLAVWAPGLLTDDSFLYNGIYHVQPADPDSGKIIFPVAELVSDNLLGESDGFVEFLKDPIKIVSVLFTQMLEAAKHSGTGYEMDPTAYATPEEAERAKKYGAYSNQRYEMKEGHAGRGMAPIQGLAVPQPNMAAMQNATAFIDELSSAPKALQGISENSSTPAALNAQRIEQASTQLSIFLNHYKQYLRHTLKLRYAYWRESYTEQMTFRITSPEGGSERMTVNELVPETGWDGMPTGEVRKINDISAAEFDIVISDSYRSPTYRAKMSAVISELLKNPAIAQNPNMAMLLVGELFNLSDISHETKEKLKQMEAQTQQQQMAQPPQTEQMQQMQGAA